MSFFSPTTSSLCLKNGLLGKTENGLRTYHFTKFCAVTVGRFLSVTAQILAASLEIGTAHDTIHDPQLSSSPCYLA